MNINQLNKSKHTNGLSGSNNGTTSLVDAMDNFEALSTSMAKQIEPTVVRMIQDGASNQKVAEYISEQAGEKGNAAGWMDSWKWNLLVPFIDAVRQQAAIDKIKAQEKALEEQYEAKQNDSNSGNQVTNNSGNIPQNNSQNVEANRLNAIVGVTAVLGAAGLVVYVIKKRNKG